LGRFKPVYIAYVRAMKSVKNTTDLNDMEKKLTAFQALQVLDKVHFKNQSDLNPYNIMVSPFEDPGECDYDFDDIGKRYEDVKELLKEQAAKSPEGDKSLETQKKEDDEDAWSVKNVAKTAFKYSPAGAAVWAIKKSGQGIKDALTWVSEGLGKTFGGMWDKFTGVIGEKWQSFKDTVKGVWEAISNPLDFAKKLATGAMDKVSEGVDNVKDAASSAGQAISGGWDDAKNAIGLNSKVGTGEKGIIAAGKAAGMTDEELAMFLAQTAHESGNFRSTTENLNYSATTLMKLFPKRFPDRAKAQAVVAAGQEAIGNAIYGGRMGNGPGEGFKYRGRGYIQLTGKDNYKAFAKASGLDVVNNPDLVSSPEGAIKASLWYWNSRKGLRDAAKKGDVNTATKLINGGSNGLADRQQKYAKYLQMVKSGDYSKMGAVPQGTASTGTAPASASSAPATPPKASAAATSVSTGVSGGSGGSATSVSSAPAGDATMATKSATYNTGAVSSATPATPASAAVKPAATGAANAMALAKPELITLGKTHYRLKDNKVTLAGMNETFMALFWAMLGEAKQKGCMVVQINEGVRTLAEQHRLYNLYKAGKGPLAAVPGTSRHGKGEAMDCNTVNCDELDKKGLLAKYGFSRPLMKRLASGKMTETWHIENKFVPKAGGQAPKYPQVNDPESKQNATRAPGEIGGRQSVVNTGNAAINDVVNQGGGSNTASVASAQQADSLTQSGVASILTKQLAVQTEMKSVLVEIRDHLIRGNDPKAKQELDQLKKPQSAEDIGAAIGGNIADLLANKLGLGKPAETAKPLPVISASK
jgi:putative chitinase